MNLTIISIHDKTTGLELPLAIPRKKGKYIIEVEVKDEK